MLDTEIIENLQPFNQEFFKYHVYGLIKLVISTICSESLVCAEDLYILDLEIQGG